MSRGTWSSRSWRSLRAAYSGPVSRGRQGSRGAGGQGRRSRERPCSTAAPLRRDQARDSELPCPPAPLLPCSPAPLLPSVDRNPPCSYFTVTVLICTESGPNWLGMSLTVPSIFWYWPVAGSIQAVTSTLIFLP